MKILVDRKSASIHFKTLARTTHTQTQTNLERDEAVLDKNRAAAVVAVDDRAGATHHGDGCTGLSVLGGDDGLVVCAVGEVYGVSRPREIHGLRKIEAIAAARNDVVGRGARSGGEQQQRQHRAGKKTAREDRSGVAAG